MSYPESKLTGLTGFALAAKVTGGWAGQVVSITTLDQLKANIGDTTPRVLVINSNISAASLTKVNMGANKTLIGSFQNRTLENIHLRATAQSQNIILQNIIFKHSASIKANDDIQVYLNYGSQYWIDHCSFVGHNWSTTDGSEDKLVYIGEKADYATISNCFFGNHKYGLIFGHPADDNKSEFNGYPRLTLCHNRFDNMEVRAPGLMRYGYFHVYNNYVNNFHLGFTLAQNANILSESNYFGEGSQNNGMLDDKGTGTFTDTNSVPAITRQKSPNAKWTARSNYNYTLKTAAQAREFTQKNAGAQAVALVFGS
ncbi:pectate lyase [Pseudomonas sp. 2822-15]|uniref:Pectate lyase n=1 Tax=Pseudomonas salomonii TaxID=191391 RepID=A0A1H3PPT0_9PSED|nr:MULTISPECIES: pectate lyase [Pseudomonas]NWF07898.1 pectate lyase [Pseudomonas salomonii]PIB40387.1 pectate lyase [Pseudomonas sp. 2822-15]CRM82205.1 Pectin lyase [Pseudomonas sp. 58 R 3]SDZ02905.1 pectin lyase [Pseudomonas salomonii]